MWELCLRIKRPVEQMAFPVGGAPLNQPFEDKTMKCFSVRHPWAFWMMKGWKTVETRKNRILQQMVGQRFAIQGARLLNLKAFDMAAPYLTKRQMEITKEQMRVARDAHRRNIPSVDPRFGAIVATFRGVEIRRLTEEDEKFALFDCAGLWGLFISDIQIIDPPIPWKGRIGTMDVPDNLIPEGESV